MTNPISQYGRMLPADTPVRASSKVDKNSAAQAGGNVGSAAVGGRRVDQLSHGVFALVVVRGVHVDEDCLAANSIYAALAEYRKTLPAEIDGFVCTQSFCINCGLPRFHGITWWFFHAPQHSDTQADNVCRLFGGRGSIANFVHLVEKFVETVKQWQGILSGAPAQDALPTDNNEQPLEEGSQLPPPQDNFIKA